MPQRETVDDYAIGRGRMICHALYASGSHLSFYLSRSQIKPVSCAVSMRSGVLRINDYRWGVLRVAGTVGVTVSGECPSPFMG